MKKLKGLLSIAPLLVAVTAAPSAFALSQLRSMAPTDSIVTADAALAVALTGPLL